MAIWAGWSRRYLGRGRQGVIGLCHGREHHGEAGADGRCAAHPQHGMVFTQNAMHHGQAEAGSTAGGLGGEERFENARQRLRCHAGAVVVHFDAQTDVRPIGVGGQHFHLVRIGRWQWPPDAAQADADPAGGAGFGQFALTRAKGAKREGELAQGGVAPQAAGYFPEPKKVRTVSVKPDGSLAPAPQQQAARPPSIPC